MHNLTCRLTTPVYFIPNIPLSFSIKAKSKFMDGDYLRTGFMDSSDFGNNENIVLLYKAY